MKQNDFYEVNGCNWFIPVDLIEEDKCTKELEVVTRESGRTISVPSIYKFPKPQEPQKPVVPKFVAEWIERQKESFSDVSAIDMYDNLTLDNNGGHYHDVWLWVIDHHYAFIKAWHDGYTVEKEKLYTVEIPNPNLNAHVVLQKTEKGIVLVTVTNARWRGWKNSKLTESEIKQDFDFLWQFAREVGNDTEV